MPDAGNLFAYNRYMYVAGNPLRLTDSSGHVWETVVDAVSVGYGIYDIYQNGLNWENGTSLAVDVVSTAVPFVPAPGACVRWCDDAVQYGDDAAGWVGNKVDEGVDAAKRWWNGNPCANSFSADTLVMTAGGAKPIAALVEGDIVLAYNEATGRIEVHPITDTISHVDPEIVLLTIDGETLETTAEHPFYEMEGAPLVRCKGAGPMRLTCKPVTSCGRRTARPVWCRRWRLLPVSSGCTISLSLRRIRFLWVMANGWFIMPGRVLVVLRPTLLAKLLAVILQHQDVVVSVLVKSMNC